MASMHKRTQRALHFVREKHVGQFHAKNLPVWHHMARVSNRLDFALNIFSEGVQTERETIVLAALGHDVLEDTNATQEEVRDIFGEDALEIILGMTNDWGDENITPYVEKVVSGPESVRLTKLSDLCDNMTSVTYTLPILGQDWLHSFFLPIVTPMKTALVETEFKKFTQTANLLTEMVDVADIILRNEAQRYAPDAR
jgi:(p)ppGpp synthase/HD superfamily hydrolase